MAAAAAVEKFEAGYGKYFGERFGKLTDKTTEDEIKKVYQEWATQYDKVSLRFIIIHVLCNVPQYSNQGDEPEPRSSLALIRKLYKIIRGRAVISYSSYECYYEVLSNFPKIFFKNCPNTARRL